MIDHSGNVSGFEGVICGLCSNLFKAAPGLPWGRHYEGLYCLGLNGWRLYEDDEVLLSVDLFGRYRATCKCLGKNVQATHIQGKHFERIMRAHAEGDDGMEPGKDYFMDLASGFAMGLIEFG